MSNQATIPKAVLSDQIHQALAGRPVKAAIFLTFQFDPGFFEEEILPVLFDQSFSHVPKIGLVQLEEVMRSLNLAVYYDRSGLVAEAKPARLDYQRIGFRRSTGFFHPKNILLLVQNANDEEYWDSLLFVTLSANLTRAGWWENVEVTHLEEIKWGQDSSLRQDVRDLLASLEEFDRTGREHRALNALRSFLANDVSDAKHKRQEGRWLPRLYLGRQSVPAFLQPFIPPHQFNLEVISPYFDDTASAGTLGTLLEAVKPQETRLSLPEGKDGAALCHRQFFEAVEQRRVKWSRLPVGPLRPSEPGGLTYRFVHAKVYRFWNKEREILFVGSVNLTQAAHQGRGGNFETGLLIELQNATQGWWLEPLQQDRPTEFRPENTEEPAVNELVGRLSLRFDWAGGTLAYFWESAGKAGPQSAQVSAQGVPKFTIEPVQFDAWTGLPPSAAQMIKELLETTSLVEVTANDGSSFPLLIEEEGMACKPSILLNLSAEEILQYWSLLSPEQREGFIVNRAPDWAEGTELVPAHSQAPIGQTMFDRFAGIFHAFGRMERHISEALENERDKELVYCLFGQKYDSLPSLIDKVAQAQEADRANRYVTLLCARQLLQKIEKKYPDFMARYRADLEHVHQKLSLIDQIQAGFSFASEPERRRFFAWFEEMFFMEIPVEEKA